MEALKNIQSSLQKDQAIHAPFLFPGFGQKHLGFIRTLSVQGIGEVNLESFQLYRDDRSEPNPSYAAATQEQYR
jgi:hypothetical protein